MPKIPARSAATEVTAGTTGEPPANSSARRRPSAQLPVDEPTKAAKEASEPPVRTEQPAPVVPEQGDAAAPYAVGGVEWGRSAVGHLASGNTAGGGRLAAGTPTLIGELESLAGSGAVVNIQLRCSIRCTDAVVTAVGSDFLTAVQTEGSRIWTIPLSAIDAVIAR